MIKKNFSLGFDKAFQSALCILDANIEIDSLMFRRGFEEDTTISHQERKEIITYLKKKITKGDQTYSEVKNIVDQCEMASDYFHSYPKMFRGSYYPVVIKTLAGIMLVPLLQANNN